RPFILFYALSLIPPAAYYGYGIVIADFMRWKVSSSFRPYLLARPDFWLEWFDLGASAVGYAALGLALVGFSLLGKRYARALIIGLALGYVVFGVVFTFHIHTHG